MDVQFYGANCVSLATKQARVVFDDNLAELGGKPALKAGDIALYTSRQTQIPKQELKIMIDQPGEYEVSGISVYGIQARAHMDEQGKQTATIYKLVIDDLRVLVTGHIYPELSDKQLESIGMIDIMIVPVGGNGYTLDGIGALKLIRKIEPKMVIPTNYDMKGVNYPVPQQTLQDALKSLAMEPKETVSGKLRIKSTDLSDVTQLVVLEA
ncbi:MAG TPA: MBL fold metallo-hydrolase [Candidatus Saccharimonadales bacterium]|nr:MBL fold metallo-hydrolase [Candidatus Saccharimonadales bacterium]